MCILPFHCTAVLFRICRITASLLDQYTWFTGFPGTTLTGHIFQYSIKWGGGGREKDFENVNVAEVQSGYSQLFSFFFLNVWINTVMIKCSCAVVVPLSSSPTRPRCFGSFPEPAGRLRGERARFGPAGWVPAAPGRSHHQGHMGTRNQGENEFWENRGGRVPA